MEIEIANNARMAQTGSSLLRILQNHETPLLDLLVRESIQNSLDAANTSSNINHVTVEFFVRNFNVSQLSKEFKGISDKLDDKFPEDSTLLEIRDSNTVGLTGHKSELNVTGHNDFGNLLKLVYHISRHQQNEGAGGSWGLGKTVYYRIGIGLVIYYSRIINDKNEYESRLAACLVEDETSPTKLLPDTKSGAARGIAWWGRHSNDTKPKSFFWSKPTPDDAPTEPVTDENEISVVLKAIGCKPYKNTETGTTIVIPFLHNDLLGNHSNISILDDEKFEIPPWCTSIQRYLETSVQRWYAPRIDNSSYPYGKWLNVYINGRRLSRDNFMPLFQKLHDMYKYAFEFSKDKTILEHPIFKCEELNLRGIFQGSSTAGWFVYGTFSEDQIRMTAPDHYPSPTTQITDSFEDDASINPIIAVTRRPGMIVNYDISGSMVKSITRNDLNGYFIGLFVADSSKLIKLDEKNTFSLEEYLRKCEKADHSEWYDWNLNNLGLNIVKKIRFSIAKKITKFLSEKSAESPVQKDIALSRLLADVLLPDGFADLGHSIDSTTKPKIPHTGGSKSAISLIMRSSPKYLTKGVQLFYELHVNSLVREVFLELRVLSESGEISLENWDQTFSGSTPFPVEIEEVLFEKIQQQGRPIHPNISVTAKKETIGNKLEIEILNHGCNKINNGLLFSLLDNQPSKLYFTLTVKHTDPLFQICLTVSNREVLTGVMHE